MKKTLLIVASFAPSLVNFRYELMQDLLQANYQVIACAPHDADIAKKVTQLGVRFISLPLGRTNLNPFSDLLFLLRLIKIMRKLKPDAVLSYTHKPVIYASLAAKITGVPHIYSMITGLGYAFSTNAPLVLLLVKKLFKISLRYNNYVFFQNKDNINTFLQMRLINVAQVVQINGSGINLTYFMPTPLPNTCSFLMIGRYLKDKGIREYIAAARIVKSSHPHISFKLAGWIDCNPNAVSQIELNSWIKEEVIEDLGKLVDVREAIAKASVFVLPSYSEGVPHTVLEAMAMARPIITTNAPGCRETVIPGVNGFLVPVKDEKALADAMQQFITRFDLCEQMGKASRKIAEDKFDVSKVNEIIIRTINRVC